MLIIASAEVSFLLGHRFLCIALHSLAILYAVSLVLFKKEREVVAFVPVSTFRIANLSMPILFPMTIYWLTLLYASMLPCLFYVVRALDLRDLGFGSKWMYLLPVSAVVGYVFGLLDFKMYHTSSIATNVMMSIVFSYVLVGLVEELMFRSILQTAMEDRYGRWGLPISATTFALMRLKAFPLMLLFGLILGLTFQRTRNVLLTIAMNGTATLFAFGLLPMGIGSPTFLV